MLIQLYKMQRQDASGNGAIMAPNATIAKEMAAIVQRQNA
jgi:hypothetical protein